jgi:hypothetical protein
VSSSSTVTSTIHTLNGKEAKKVVSWDRGIAPFCWTVHCQPFVYLRFLYARPNAMEKPSYSSKTQPKGLWTWGRNLFEVVGPGSSD